MATAPHNNGSDEPDTGGDDGVVFARPPADLLRRLETDIPSAGGEQPPDPAMEGAIGATMFDQPGSEDNSATVLLPRDKVQLAPSQSLVRIRSRDGRKYLGIVTAGPFAEIVNKTEYKPYNAALRTDAGRASLAKHIKAKEMQGNAQSWGKLKSLLWRLHRLKVFDRHMVRQGKAPPVNYQELIEPGRLSVADLSDTGMTELANLAIADLLRGVQGAQEAAYRRYEVAKRAGQALPPLPRVLLILEEAHEFLSADRIERMDTLFQQVARIAKRGRKRWLSLAFVTHVPQQLPRQIYGLVNSYVLHKITDPQVVRDLKQTVSGIDESLWRRLPSLAQGQAIVSFPHMARPLLVAIDPAPCKLRMVD
jgi:hypothetical protein